MATAMMYAGIAPVSVCWLPLYPRKSKRPKGVPFINPAAPISRSPCRPAALAFRFASRQLSDYLAPRIKVSSLNEEEQCLEIVLVEVRVLPESWERIAHRVDDLRLFPFFWGPSCQLRHRPGTEQHGCCLCSFIP